MHQTSNTPPSGIVPKHEIALRYFPNATSKKQATDSLTRWINRCKPLSMAMARTFYRTTDKYYTPPPGTADLRLLGRAVGNKANRANRANKANKANRANKANSPNKQYYSAAQVILFRSSSNTIPQLLYT